MYLFFDTSAAGRPKSWKSPVEETFSWPRMIHMAWEYIDNDSNIIESENHIIRPEGFEISQESTEFNGISHEQAVDEGKELKPVLEQFAQVIDKAEYVISFNFTFNSRVFGAECIRKGVSHRLFSSDYYCLMQETTFYTKKMGRDGRYKWPTLMELFQKVYGQKFADANRADQDVRATSMIFFKLLSENVLELD